MKRYKKRYVLFLSSGVVVLALAILCACVPASPVSPPMATATSTASPTTIPPTVTTTVTPTATPQGAYLRGMVVNVDGLPVAGARVRIKATENKTITDAEGAFALYGLAEGGQVTVTAWSQGYFVGWVEDALAVEQPVTITLKPLYTTDNTDYTWFSNEGVQGSLSCSHCMPCYTEWQADAHSQSAVNPRFLTIYNGTDVNGNRSPLTRYGYSRDYGSFPLRPDPNQPYYGPGYKLDFPDTAGNCATCHIPAMTAKPGLAYAADPNLATGIETEGVFCEFCHKIGDITLNPATSLPYPNMPGTLSMRLYRPGPDQQLFFGNFDDITRRVSYNPLYEQSQYCAPCHFGVFWNTVVYNSFGEWLESPYSDPQTGKTCQNCHMPPVDYNYLAFPEKGGLTRDHNRIYSHRMPGASDIELLQNAVTMTVDAKIEGGQLIVEVKITNDKTGHHVPTDSPLRQMLLLVNATDGQGQVLPFLNGEKIPEWGGVGDPIQGYFAGLPGKAYAKILMELWTEITPSGAYWNHTRIVSDNRIAAFESDTSTYTFNAPSDGKVNLKISLLFRRAFKELMDQKGWDVADIVMEEETLTLP
jgi:hypothetical protein